MVEILRSFTEPALARLAVVMASRPDLVEQEWSGLMISSANITAGEIALKRFPSGRMTRRSFPGLHS